METFKILPNGWDLNKSYLIAKKVKSSTSYGKVFETYEVLKRAYFDTRLGQWLESESLKGSEYTKGELKLIAKVLV